MILNRKSPEAELPSAEFIKVVYDDKGKPIDVLPMKNPPLTAQQEKPSQPKIEITRSSASQDSLTNWVVNLGQHVKALRQELRILAIFTQKKFDELQPLISNQIENSVSKSSPVIVERFGFVEGEISKLRNQYMLMLESLQALSRETITLTKKLEAMNFSGKVISDQLNSLGLHVSNVTKEIVESLQPTLVRINGLAKEIEEMRSSHISILNQMGSLDLRMSSIAKEIGGSKAHEVETSEKLKSLVEEIQGSKLSDVEMAQRLGLIEDEMKKLGNQIALSNSYTDEMTKKVDQKVKEFSVLTGEIIEKFGDISSKQEESIAGLKREMKSQFESFIAGQEELTTKLYEKTNRRFTRLLNKMKKGNKKISRARIVRLLKKKIEIVSFNKVLIVSDKKNSIFSNLLFDVARKINKKTVLITMDNRKKLGEEPEESVRDLMVKADLVIIVAKYSLEKTEALRECVDKGKKVVAVKRSLRVTPF